jgi:uroporphyrinogen-III decarboxylase
MNYNDEIKKLQETIRELEQSEENRKRRDKWECIPDTARDQWRGLPKFDGSCLKGNVPVQIDPNNTFWSKYFKFSIKEYFLDPKVFVENFLKITIERFKLFDDDVFITKKVPLWMGSGYEASLFGMNVLFFDDVDPWIDYVNVINKPEDLDKLQIPNFHNSGLMPQAIRMYEGVKVLLDDDFEVFFPEWLRGPFGLATYMRSFENVLMDMLDEPEFSHRLMRFLVDSRKAWYDSLEKYLGRKVIKANLFNDEVNCPSLSPALYGEFVLPYEKELCDYHHGLHYWHSCGNLTELYGKINEIPNIDMIHKGPWSGSREVGKIFGNRSVIEVCMDSQGDIFQGTEESMRKKLTGIVTDLTEEKVKGYTLRANNIMFVDSWDNSISKARMFINVARQVVDSITKQCNKGDLK